MDEEKHCCNDKKLDITDGVTEKEASTITIILVFVATWLLGCYLAFKTGDFPANVTSLLGILAGILGAVKAATTIPKVLKK